MPVAPSGRDLFMMLVAVPTQSMLPLKIFFGICLIAVLFAAVQVFRKRKQLFGRDPQVTGDHYASRNLRAWQVILVLVLTIELLITMILRL